MTLQVGLLGNSRVAFRLADAVSAQPDMRVSGLWGWDQASSLATQRGFHVVSTLEQLREKSQFLLVAATPQIRILPADLEERRTNAEPERLFSCLAPWAPTTACACAIPGADSVALSRVVKCVKTLSAVQRLATCVLRRAAHASDAANGSVDALRPVFGRRDSLAELKTVLADHVARVEMQTVIAPITHSNLHMMRIDLATPVGRDALSEALHSEPRIFVASAADGFRSTADVNEFFRDYRRLRGDRWEVFVWEESIMAIDRSVYLTLDIGPDATPIPEAIDALRQMADLACGASQSRSQTDQSLGVLDGVAWLKRSSARDHPECVTARPIDRSPTPDDSAKPFAPRLARNARVGVLGYGVIGRRLADAVARQPDMDLIGVAVRSDSLSLRDLCLAGHRIYLTDEPHDRSLVARLPAQVQPLETLLSSVDVLLDCTPAHVPRSYRDVLKSYPQLVSIVQGGESADDCEVSFNSMANYSEAAGKKRVRVISCSSTGTTRLLYALDRSFGVERAFVALARRAADPGKVGRTPFNSLTPTMGQSHHGADVATVASHLNVVSVSTNCPTTFSHALCFCVDLREAPTESEVAAALDKTPRILVGDALDTTAQLAEHFNDLGRHRYDRPEIYVFRKSLQTYGNSVMATISVHMESITIPETIDCVRAALGMADTAWDSIARTDHALEIDRAGAVYGD